MIAARVCDGSYNIGKKGLNSSYKKTFSYIAAQDTRLKFSVNLEVNVSPYSVFLLFCVVLLCTQFPCLKLKVEGCSQPRGCRQQSANSAESSAGAGRHGDRKLPPESKRLRLMHVTTPRFVPVFSRMSPEVSPRAYLAPWLFHKAVQGTLHIVGSVFLTTPVRRKKLVFYKKIVNQVVYLSFH